MSVLQAANPVAVAGTVGLFALFLSVTAYLAARNVFGDVSPVRALGVGPVPAALSTLPNTVGLSPGVALAGALVADVAAFYLLYERDPKLSVYAAFIHVVVTIIAGAGLYALLALYASAPG